MLVLEVVYVFVLFACKKKEGGLCGNLPGQGLLTQPRVSVEFPTHLWPLLAGAGLEHSLWRL